MNRSIIAYFKAMVFRIQACLVFFTLTIFFGCDAFYAPPSNLTAQSSVAPEGPNCASCHGYPLTDANHEKHVGISAENISGRGIITCLDCHNKSILYVDKTFYDSLYIDSSSGEPYRTSANPNSNAKNQQGTLIRSFKLTQVDTFPRHEPTVLPDRPGKAPAFQEYMTALAHMNGKVDVIFDSRVSNRTKFNGASASYNPTLETCSAVECHEGKFAYRFASPSKRLMPLNGQDPNYP